MRVFKLAVLSLVLFSWCYPVRVRAQTIPVDEKQKIEALIKVVGQLKTAKFVRNGWSYSSDTAAFFLRKKWEANEAGIKTAKDFIERIGSSSGTSGKPYLVRLRDGTELESRTFLLAELKKIETALAQLPTAAAP